MNINHRGIVCLLKSAIIESGVELPEGFALDAAVELGSRQGVLPLIYQGAVNCGIENNQAVMQKLMRHYYHHMVISERQMRAVAQLLEAFNAHGIDHMPLKGCNMKHLYPRSELRTMGDADILIRLEQLPLCSSIMKSMGYRLKLESDHTDNWQSDSLYVELHKSVVPREDEDYYAYYGTGWGIGVKGEGCRYDPSPEDTFLFLFTHFARHYRISGIGCRHVLDLYVYRRANPQMDERYIRGELKKLRLLDFYENVLRLLDVWFAEQETDEITELMTAFIFSGGSWGTMEAGLYYQEMKQAAKKGELRSVGFHAMARAIFPPRSVLQNRYQILRRVPLLLPVMWVVRWCDVLLFSRKKLARKMKILWGIEENRILTHRQALNAVGLDFHND